MSGYLFPPVSSHPLRGHTFKFQKNDFFNFNFSKGLLSILLYKKNNVQVVRDIELDITIPDGHTADSVFSNLLNLFSSASPVTDVRPPISADMKTVAFSGTGNKKVVLTLIQAVDKSKSFGNSIQIDIRYRDD